MSVKPQILVFGPLFALIMGLFLSETAAQEPTRCTCEKPEGHAPIGVMGDHAHDEGESMISYRYMFMDMDGNRSGSHRIGNTEVLSNYMVTPTDMEMHMHMLSFMYAPIDDFTLMAMFPFTEISMNHLTRAGTTFKTQASGLGDIQITGLWKLLDGRSHRAHFNAGVSLPSGSIDERDDTPAGAQSKLPYPMQLGSGTVDLRPGLTYSGEHERVSWGSQAIGTVRLGENDNDYTLGDRFDASMWGAYAPSDWLSGSLRIAYQHWGNIDGADPDLNPMMISTADPDLRGGTRWDLGIGMNFYVPEGPMEGFRLAGEMLLPFYQDLDGPQLETDLTLVFGAQMTF